MSTPQRLYWKDEGEILRGSMAKTMLPNDLAAMKPYAIIPDDLWEFLWDTCERKAKMPLEMEAFVL